MARIRQCIIITAITVALIGCGGPDSPPASQGTPTPEAYPADVYPAPVEVSPIPADAYPAESYPMVEATPPPNNQTESYPEPEAATSTP
jgi:hypothetical protein